MTVNIRSIAKRYAGAFYAEYKDSAKAATIWQELDELVKLQETNKDLEAVIINPLINVADKRSVFTALSKSGKISDELYMFIMLLIDKKRLMLLPMINEEIKQSLLSAKGELEAIATFASEVDENTKKSLEDKLSKATGKKVNLQSKIDADVIGGVKVRLGSILYDASVKGQLDKLKSSLV